MPSSPVIPFAHRHRSASTAPARTIAGLPLDVVSAALTGDSLALSELLRHLRPMLVRYCRTRIANQAAHGGADDVAQEICLAILRGLPRFTGGPHGLVPWVYGIAAHKVVDYYHRGRRDRSDPTENLPVQEDPRPGPEELALRDEQRAIVRSLLARLKPVQRKVLTLRVVLGLTTAEVAAVTGLSATAVRAAQHRAVQALRRHLVRRRPGAD